MPPADPSSGVLAELEARTPPWIALVFAVAAVSFSAVLVRWSNAPSVVKALYRVAFTIFLLAPLAARDLGALRRLSKWDFAVATVAGLALAAHFATWFESLRYTSVAASVTLVQSQPLFVAVGAALWLDERISVRKALGIAVALAGMVVMSAGDLLGGAALAGGRPLLGDALAVFGAVMAAGYVLAGRSLRQRVPLLPYVTVVYTACALVLLGVAVGRGHPLGGYPTREWLLFLGMAVGPGVFGHTVVNWALAHVESSVVSVSLLGEPVGSTLLALALLGEVPGVSTLVGGSVVLAGIYLTVQARTASA